MLWQAPGLERRFRITGDQRPRPLSQKAQHHGGGDPVQAETGAAAITNLQKRSERQNPQQTPIEE